MDRIAMRIQGIQTERVAQTQDLCAWIDRFLPTLTENSVVAITSKVVSICEGRKIAKTSISKEALVAQEADRIIPDPAASDHRIVLTYKSGLLIPSAGIDESNGNGFYILYPKQPFQSMKIVWEHLRQRHHIQHLGLLMTDSHTTPMRYGVTGIALAWWGFQPMANYIGHPDLFGQPLRVTKINVADALAVSAVFTMGESSESTPLAVLTDIPHIIFDANQHHANELCIPPEEDLYRPLLNALF